MKICSLASGSKGNCQYIETENAKVLLDAGMSTKYIVECLQKLEVNPADIDAIIITHEHSDHIKGVEGFSKKFDTPIFCALNLYNVLCAQMSSCVKLIQPYNSSFYIKNLKIIPIELSHDSHSCFGYRMEDETGSASFVTDTGYLPDLAEKIISGSSLIFLESNYDPDMLYACNYPLFLKKRIVGNKGHLSNLDCAKVIERIIKYGTRQIVLSHISENSNTPYLAYNTVKNYLASKGIEVGKDINIGVNFQGKMNTIYKLKNNSK